jgi:hypothetical protein
MTAPTPLSPEEIERLQKRLREPLPVCPFDSRSPDYRKDFTGKPCPVCGGTEDGPDLCRGADTRIMDGAADALADLSHQLAAERDDYAAFAKSAGAEVADLRRQRAEARAAYDQLLTTWAECRQLLSEARAEVERVSRERDEADQAIQRIMSLGS